MRAPAGQLSTEGAKLPRRGTHGKTGDVRRSFTRAPSCCAPALPEGHSARKKMHSNTPIAYIFLSCSVGARRDTATKGFALHTGPVPFLPCSVGASSCPYGARTQSTRLGVCCRASSCVRCALRAKRNYTASSCPVGARTHNVC